MSDWNSLRNADKVQLLRDMPDDDIVREYRPPSIVEDEFRRMLQRDRAFWKPEQVAESDKMGQPPTKSVTIGAGRDLTRVEALLELMDNSIDSWLRRKASVGSKYVAQRLQIYVKVYPAENILEYRDNAGGVPPQKFNNLVTPGYSDTTATERSIGSYQTGGKKALFRLGDEVNIRTNYWDPSGASNDAYEVHLDKKWLEDETDYQFPFFRLKSSPDEPGQTVFRFRMKRESVEITPWYQNPDVRGSMTKEIQRTYTLLLLRHPEIEVYLLDTKALTFDERLYDFTALRDSGTNLRPQRVVFSTTVDYQGSARPVEIEIMLGCRTSGSGDEWGVDLYGNDRLFLAYEQDFFVETFHMLTGQTGRLFRGLINIQGPNVLIPWDTHKRHFNDEREIVALIKRDPAIGEFFRNWRAAFQRLQKGGKGEQRKLSTRPLKSLKALSTNDLSIPAVNVTIGTKGKGPKKEHLPDSVPPPKVKMRPSAKENLIKVPLQVTDHEFKILTHKYSIKGTSDDNSVRQELADKIKEVVLRSRSWAAELNMDRPGKKPFGPCKYAAFNLMLARWTRHFAAPNRSYVYVTLGGANLHDVAFLSWINGRFISKAYSYEIDAANHALAAEAAARLLEREITVELRNEDVFTYVRDSDDPHIFYIDLPETLSTPVHGESFWNWFKGGTVRAGDLLMLTSTLQRGAGRKKQLQDFENDFSVLRQLGMLVDNSVDSLNATFEMAHPFFVLHRALRDAGVDDQIMLRSVGFVKYRDNFTLGLYGIACLDGAMDFRETIRNVSGFDMTRRESFGGIGLGQSY